MGWSVGWYACSDMNVDEAAAVLDFEIGDERPVAEGPCIAAVGSWVLVYNDGQPLLDDASLRELSNERTVVVHESVDSVMYSRSARWENGALAWSATVNLDTVDDDSAVITTGLAAAIDTELRRTYQQSGSSAYGRVADLAAEVVGFRHDQTRTSGLPFRALVDNRPAAPSVPDRVAGWLIDQGFIAKDPGADGSDERPFRRHVDGDFFVVATISGDESQFADTWCAANFGIRHEGAAKVDRSRGAKRELPPEDFRPTALVSLALDGFGAAHPPSSEPVAYDDVIAWMAWQIERAESYCTEERLLVLCVPGPALRVEVAYGWSNRGESLLKEIAVHDRLAQHHNAAERPVFTDWVDEHRAEPRYVEPPQTTRTLAETVQRFDDGQVCSGPELAVVQAERGVLDDALAEALAFGHWLRVLDHEATLALVGAHVARHHLLHFDADAVARSMEMPVEVQQVLAERSGHQLGFNDNLDPAIQLTLAANPRHHSTVGQCPGLVPEAQRMLMAEPSEYLAGNPALLSELQPEFASSTNYRLREGLARNPAVLPELLAKLVNDRKGIVKFQAARNPSLPEQLQHELLEKKSSDIQNGLQWNLGLAPSVQRRIAERGELVRLARNPQLLRELMDTLANDASEANRAEVAQNVGLPPDIVERLASDPEPSVRQALAFNFELDRAVMERLCADEDAQVARRAKQAAARRGWYDL